MDGKKMSRGMITYILLKLSPNLSTGNTEAAVDVSATKTYFLLACICAWCKNIEMRTWPAQTLCRIPAY